MTSSGGHRPSWPEADTDPTGDGWSDEPTAFHEAMSEGSFFGDRFQLGKNLGSGAMGRVIHATDLTSGTEVALKILHRERAKDPEAVERLAREAAILGAIGHPGIVRVVAMGRAPDGTPWLAMELLRGQTLKARILRGPMHAMEVLPILVTICDALAAAHHAGVVHRDLKPENVILLEPGPAGVASPPCKILDFGLSRFTASKTLTRTGTILGTPRYMAPEQIQSASGSTHRVDLFAVGVLLYEMLTGRSPYPAEDLGQLLGCVLEGRTIPLAQLRPDLPPGVSAVIARAMAARAEDRFETAGAIAEAYANALGVRSGRSNLFATNVPITGADDHGAQPLVDPFAAGPLAGMGAAASLDIGELARDPLLATVPPVVMPPRRTPAQGIAPPGTPARGLPRDPTPSSMVRPGAVQPIVQPQPAALPQAAAVSLDPAGAAPPQRASWPGGQPDFTRPRPSLPSPTPKAGAKPAADRAPAARRGSRSPLLGCALFVIALAIVIVVAAIGGVVLRALTDGRVTVPGIGSSVGVGSPGGRP